MGGGEGARMWLLLLLLGTLVGGGAGQCSGGDDCCTPQDPCGNNDGDCDTDDDCAGLLVCGNNNCPQDLFVSLFDVDDDCCELASTTSTTSTTSTESSDSAAPLLSVETPSVPATDWTCSTVPQSMKNVMEIPTLGRPVMLGELYSMYKDQFMPSFSLWSYEDIEKSKTTLLIPSAEEDFDYGETLDDRFKKLDVKASLKASFQAGMVELSGSARVLQLETDYEHKAHVRLSYLSKTRSESLGQDLTCKAAPRCARFSANTMDENSPTHVVSQIIYGGNAHFVFEEDIDADEDILYVYGKLSVTVKLAIMKITGEGEVTYNKTSSNNDTYIKIKMFSDFIVEQQPISVEQAIGENQKISSYLGSRDDNYNYSVPMKAVLIPISQYCPEAQTSLEENIGESLIEEAVMKYTMLQDTDKTLERLLKTYAATYNLHIRVLLKAFQQKVSTKTNDYSLKLVKYIPMVKQGSASGREALNDLIKNYTDSCFDLDSPSMFIYVQRRKREVAAINKFYQQTMRKRPGENVPIIAQFQRAQIPIALIDSKLVFILDMCIIPKNVQFNATNCEQNEKEEGNWYDNRTLSGIVGKQWRNYLSFVKANLNITGPGNVSTYFVDIHDTDDPVCEGDTAALSLYKDGKMLGSFQVPDVTDEEPSVCRKERGRFIIHVKNPPKQQGISNITKVRFNYTIDDSNPDFLGWKVHENIIEPGDYTRVSIGGIDSELSYKFNVSYVTEYGVGPPSRLFYSMGPLSERAQLPGCVIKTNKKYKNYTPVGHDMTVTQCAEKSLYLAVSKDASGYYNGETTPHVRSEETNSTDPVPQAPTPVGLFYWTYDFSSKNCFIISSMPGSDGTEVTDKDYSLESKGWALGSPSCGTTSADWKKIDYVQCEEGRGADLIETIERNGTQAEWLPNCKIACMASLDCQGLSLDSNGTCHLLKDIHLSRCSYSKDMPSSQGHPSL